MLKELIEFRPVTTLIPNTGVQFLDFGFNEQQVQKLSKDFWPELQSGEVDSSGNQLMTLHILFEDDEGNLLYRSDSHPQGTFAPEDEIYAMRCTQALDLLDGIWLPLPFLRVKEQGVQDKPLYDDGPNNWARVRVKKLSQPDNHGNTHRFTIAFDTLLLERRSDAPYAAPEPNDAIEDVQFTLVSDTDANGFFLNLHWVREWLRDSYVEGLSARRGRTLTADDIENPGEFWAAYILLLQGISSACSIPRIRFVDTVTDAVQEQPVDVDLVIDIGNSRTCGIFIEQTKQAGHVDIGKTYRLELRDLSRPEHVYSEPFESRIEFAPANFGKNEHARKSGRPRRDAFWWPSPVRIGPEAAWLASFSDGTEGVSGLSSPKRYLWDESPRPQAWSNNRGLTPLGRPVPAITGPITAKLTEEGDLVSPKRPHAVVGMMPRYSRSSLYSLMLAELLIHASNQINSVAVRERLTDADLPRRLRNFVLTLPSATPLAEQKIMRRRIEWAVDLIWETMGWQDQDRIHPRPKLKMNWDEATCTHLVYLYNEINHKFRGNPRDLFELIGSPRQGCDGLALRVASMDMGGGTTDLMIIQHEIESGNQYTVHPRQLFREGFRQAGDDIVKVVVEDCVMADLTKAVKEAGVSQPHALFSEILGGDREGMGQQERALRTLITSQMLVPIALTLLAAYEKIDARQSQIPQHFRFVDCFAEGRQPSKVLQDYVENAVRQAGGKDFSLQDVSFSMHPQAMAGAVQFVASDMIENLCDVIRAYDCDVLLLSGRPSRFPAIKDLVLGNLPVTPDRVVCMDSYEVSYWYPFRSSDYRISDPKTTAAVGAMLCQICEGIARGFVMRASEMHMKSTAKYIGVMEANDQILDRNCLLKNVDLDTGSGIVGFELKMEAPVLIGYRQLPIERWKTTPLYSLEFRNPEKVPELKTPLTVKFERADAKNEYDEQALEDFKIIEITDREGGNCKQAVRMHLQTMRVDQQAEGGYWLDTGIIRTTTTGRY